MSNQIMDQPQNINQSHPSAKAPTATPHNVQAKPKKRFSRDQKIALAAIGIVALGAIGGTAYFLTRQNSNDTATVETVTITGDATDYQLKDGDNEITTGGVYNITGSITGRLKINTTDEVKIILNGVSITNNDGQAAIKAAGTGTTVIELAGKNILKTTATTDSSDGTDAAAAISADYDLQLAGDGQLSITASTKAIKADGNLSLVGGTYNITATDDALHSNSSFALKNATVTIDTGDDAIHADEALQIESGSITVTKSNEGLEAKVITINGGDISITASDDGLNASGGEVSSSAMQFGGMMMDAPQDGVALTINGGNLYVNSNGDGLDSNGSLYINGGTTYVDGPTNDGNGALDYNGEMVISGGTLIAVGTSGMAQNATSASQPSVLINLTSSQSGEFTFGGISYSPKKNYTSILISSDQLSTGQTYDLKVGGDTVQTVTISNNITNSSTSGMMGGMGGGQMPNQQGGQAPQGSQSAQGSTRASGQRPTR